MGNAVAHVGWEGMEVRWVDGLDLSVRLACLIALLAGRGRPWGHRLASVTLAMMIAMGIRNLRNAYALHPDPPAGFMGVIFIVLMLRLWFSFTLSLPSRRFYQIAKE